MKKGFKLLSILMISGSLLACSGTAKKEAAPEALQTIQLGEFEFPMDGDGYITIFDGETLNGWRGYLKTEVPSLWGVEDGCLKYNGSGTGEEAQVAGGGDILFDHKFKNFELSVDWKVSEVGNSGIFYLVQEIPGQLIYTTAPEYQLLDDARYPGQPEKCFTGSLYDMIAPQPYNAKPAGEWNSAKITVNNGKVVHYSNGEAVVEYQMWTPEWIEMLQNSKFSEKKWPEAFATLSNCGGPDHEGFIAFQDHSTDVWFKNIKIKILE